MNVVNLISTPQSESWPIWIMFVLLLLLVLAIAHQPGLLKDGFRAIFSRLERTYADSARDIYTDLLLLLFRLGTISLTLQTIFFSTGVFRIRHFLMILLFTVVLELIRWICIRFVAYIFLSARALSQPMAYYANLQLMLALFIYPVTLLTIDFAWVTTGAVLTAIIFATYLILLTIRMARMFLSKPVAILYIALYILTLEILPIIGLCLAVRALV